MLNRQQSFLALALVLSGSVYGCAGSPYQLARMSPQQLTAVSDKDVCFAADQGDPKPTIQQEVRRRRLDCARVLLQNGLEPRNTSTASIAATGNCAGIEFMGVFVTSAVVGLRTSFAKVRNNSSVTKIVTVGYFEDGKQKTAVAEVKASEIGSIELTLSDHPVTSTRLVSCQ